MSEMVFSDDRRWLGRSTDEIERVGHTSHVIAQEACVVANLSKLQYVSLRSCADGSIQSYIGSIRVGSKRVTSSPTIPHVVGIFIESGRVLPPLLPKVMQRLRKLKHFAGKYQPNVLFAIRAIMAYPVSSLDYGARGSLLPVQLFTRVQPSINGIVRS